MFEPTRVIRRPQVARHTPRTTDGLTPPVLVRYIAPKRVVR